jgi:uncharacterized protein
MSEPQGGAAAPVESRARVIGEALLASAIVTGLVTLASLLPERYVAFAVGVVFLVATWVLVWRRDDQTVARYGLAFGGLVLPGSLDPPRLLRDTTRAVGWAFALAALTFPPFFIGWKLYWAPSMKFSLEVGPIAVLNAIVGQLAVIALPEEAFYRGYLQTRLGDAFVRKVRVFGATYGPEILVASLVFALGHVATIRNPGRLAVFFPALLFGVLRATTGGIGAGLAYHALCNLFSEALGRGYGLY